MDSLLRRVWIKTRLNARAGFTLTEILVVIVILAIIAAVAIPAMIGFIRYGQQINRMNVARTLYVSMQNQLSRAMVEGNLRSVLTEDFYVDNTTETITDGRVANLLGADFPAEDEVNRENVYFISKPAGYTPGGAGSNDVLDKFYDLLDEIIINKDILNDAILMEFNVRTGVVMSIFYGDELNLWFQGGPGSGNNRNLGYGAAGFDNVSGSRGMENDIDTPYPAFERRQGYFGVLTTGNPADIQLPDIVDIFDGTVKALEGRENVLYAELYIPENTDATSYTLELVTDNRRPFGFNAIAGVTLPDHATPLNNELYGYSPYTSGELVYLYKADLDRGTVEQHGIDLSDNYILYIWVLDCVYNDLTKSHNPSINRYNVFNTGAADPQLVRAKLTREDGVDEGAGTVSIRSDHSHYGGDSRNSYDVKSARHLNNIRYFPGGGFRQTETIDMAADFAAGNQDAPGAVTNFTPIKNFTGTYDAIDQTISSFGGEQSSVPSRIMNLNIDVTGEQNVGLFAEISRVGSGGRVNGVSIFEATIKSQGAVNVGAIAGELKDGGMIMCSNSYADVAGGSGSTGGLVGRITNGTLTHSFNAGFYDTHSGTAADSGIGSVLADGGNIGGLAGSNGGVIQFCYNNARVNIEDVELTEDEWLLSIQKEPPENNALSSAAYLGGIAGNNTGTISRSYATNFVAQYEDDSRGYSGGIAGTNAGGVISSDSRYITNGCPDVGNAPGGSSRAISKLDLMEENLSVNPASPVTFKPEEAYVADYLNEAIFPKNVYEIYPYPLLSNNMPFVDSPEDWGWEDIEDEVEIPEVRLVYYEYYDNNGTSRGYFNSFDTRPANQLQTTQNHLVHHDGYAIEFSPISGGYRVMFNEDVYIIQSDDNDVWRIYEEDEDEPLEDWLPARHFTATIDDELTDLYRLYIPNEFAEELVSDEASVDLQFFAGRDEEPLENIPDSTYSYFPLFARNTPPTAAAVRSPRHIDNITEALDGEYTQDLNVDFSIYHREIMLSGSNYVVDPATMTLDEYQAAVVTGAFTGIYSGSDTTNTAWWIAGLKITGTSDNAGLFAINQGIIRNVTLRDPLISGRDNVGAVAGRNDAAGSVTNCSVQFTVPAGTPAQSHPVAVRGTNNVGGVVGNNSGTLRDVAVVSTSNRPSIQGTSNFGGIVGTTTGTSVDRLMYLGVAPVRGVGTAAELRPYSGNGPVGDNTYFLSGRRAIRPFLTTYANATTTVQMDDYNRNSILQNGPGNTWFIYNSLRNNLWSNWSVTSAVMTQTVVENTANTLFPYPYPRGTVTPALPADWPLVIDPPLLTPDIVYYEKYADGTSGIFLRNTDGSVLLDLLNPNGIIVECGYAFRPYSQIETGQSRFWISTTGVAGSWDHTYLFKTNATPQLAGVPDLYGQRYNILMFDSFVEYYNLNNIDPARLIYVAISHTGQVNNAFLAIAMNPLFAKEVYNVSITNGVIPVAQRPAQPTTHYIHTPWQAQNISKVMGSTTSVGRTHTYIQELNLDFGSTALSAPVELVNPGGGTTNRPAGSLVNFTAANEQSNGTSAIVTNTTANIISGSFAGTYDGAYKTLSNLSLTGTASNKGLFNTITASGVVQNFTMLNCAFLNGNNNGGFAAVNNGTIRDVAFVSANSPLAVSGTGSGGIVGTHNGSMNNVMFIARAPVGAPIFAAGTGTVTDVYYLSGSEPAIVNYPEEPANRGTPKTTQELNALTRQSLDDAGFRNGIWNPSLRAQSSNTMNIIPPYPYPYIGPVQPQSWPVATIPALRLAYFERYEGDGMGFYTPGAGNGGLPPLRDNDDAAGSTILSTGYCAIVPRQGGFSVKVGANGQNTHIQALNYGAVNYVVIPETMITSNATVEVYVNDLQVTDTGRFINTMFAKGVYTSSEQINDVTQELYIRIPQHMRNVSAYASAGRKFIQERDLDFAGINLNTAGSVVSGVFNGDYDGGGNMISNLMINNNTPDASVGLFSINEGTISKLTLFFDNSVPLRTGLVVDIMGADLVGAIAGTNSGEISDITVVSSRFTGTSGVDAQAIAPVSSAGFRAGGIVGQNSGTIARVLYLAPAPANADDTGIYPIVCTNNSAIPLTAVYYLSGTAPAAIIGSDGTKLELAGNYNNPITANAGTPGDTGMLGGLSLTGWEPPAIANFVYPYPNIEKTPPGLPGIPAKWPVVGAAFIPASVPFAGPEPGMAEFEGLEIIESQGDSTGAKNADTESAGAGKTKQDNPESEEAGNNIEKESKKLENLLVVASAFTLFGGYNIVNKRTFKTRTQPIRAFMRRSNACAVRRINEHNQRSRGEP